jgi:hypothetical protein
MARARLSDAHLDTRYLRVVESVQEQQISAVFDDGDHHWPSAALGLGLRRGSNSLRGPEREHALRRQLLGQCRRSHRRHRLPAH